MTFVAEAGVNSTPSSSDSTTFETQWMMARDETDRLRGLLRNLGVTLRGFDERINKLRKARDAAESSLQLTTRAANRCGLGASPVTRGNLERLRAALDECRAGVHCVIHESEPACIEFEANYSQFRKARCEEQAALERLFAFQATQPPAPTDTVIAGRSRETPANHRERFEFLRLLDDEDRTRSRPQPDDAHYDPGYSEWEVLMRRNRPWL